MTNVPNVDAYIWSGKKVKKVMRLENSGVICSMEKHEKLCGANREGLRMMKNVISRNTLKQVIGVDACSKRRGGGEVVIGSFMCLPGQVA